MVKIRSKLYYMLENCDRKLILKQMIDLGIDMKALSDKTGYSRSYLSSILNGSRHFTQSVKDSLEAVGIELDFFCGGKR